VANCAVCREDIERGSVCPRCGSDNSNVQDLTLGYFGSIWAILSFILIFAPLFMLMPGVFSWANEILQPVVSLRVAGPIALLITLIVAFFMFSMREELHEGALTSPFKEKPGRSLPIWALTFFLLAVAIAFLLGFAITTKHLLIGAPGDWNARLQGKLVFGGTMHLLLQLVMTGCFVLLFAFFSLSAGLMAVYEYGQFVDERLPDPIYLNEQLLLEVVLKVVREELGPDVEVQITEMNRLPDAGVTLTLHSEGELRASDPKDKTKTNLLEQKSWKVSANRWGRVNKMVEASPRSIQVKDAPAPDKP
jgi:hypothetical protein